MQWSFRQQLQLSFSEALKQKTFSGILSWLRFWKDSEFCTTTDPCGSAHLQPAAGTQSVLQQCLCSLTGPAKVPALLDVTPRLRRKTIQHKSSGLPQARWATDSRGTGLVWAARLEIKKSRKQHRAAARAEQQHLCYTTRMNSFKESGHERILLLFANV